VLSTIGDVAANLVAAAIGATLVTLWHILVVRRRFRRMREFWRPFASGNSLCVTGNLSPLVLSETFLGLAEESNRASLQAVLPSLQDHIGGQEISGLMGRGDHDAVVEVQAGLARIGLASTLPELVGLPSDKELENNLIVIGGPDVNELTRSLLERLPIKLIITRNAAGRNIVRDLVHGQDYEPAVEESGKVRDYGILVRAPNPYDRSKYVLILAGAHGFGSRAAAVVAFKEEDALRQLASISAAGFECLIYNERDGIQEDSPQNTSIVMMRELSS
jgi:GrpB-like predicted nucleotidyltransferase (UPF0157 family)